MKDILQIVKAQLNMGYTLSFIEAELLKEAIDIVLNQAGNSPVTPDGWINCRERLPKPNKYVLVCNGVWVGVGMYNNAEHFEDDERWQDEHGEFIDLLHHPVTHWQSLPAAPKQENF
ncbi:DUF551 domain-containing protein [Citrobacter werkmanii]